LCEGHAHQLIERVKYADIRYVYRSVFKVSIPSEAADFIDYVRCLDCDVRFFTPAICGPPQFYEQLQRLPWYYLPEKREYQIAQRFVGADSSVLEIGCGAGNFHEFLPKGCHYRGLEFNDLAISKARDRGLLVERLTVEDLAQSEHSSFDLVCAFQVLEHVEFPGRFLKAAVRLVKPGGMLAISVPSEDSLMAYTPNNVLNTPPHHVTRWSDDALKSICRIAHIGMLHLEHEELSAVNFKGFSRAQLFRTLERHLGLRLPLVSRAAATLPIRAVIHLMAKPIEWGYRVSKRLPVGHAVVAVYQRTPTPIAGG